MTILLTLLTLPLFFLPLSATLLPLPPTTTTPHHVDLLPRAPRIKFSFTMTLTSPPTFSPPTPTVQPVIRGSVYVCEKENFQGRCRYLFEDRSITPGTAPCLDVDPGLPLGSMEAADYSYCAFFLTPSCPRPSARPLGPNRQFLIPFSPLRSPTDIPPWLRSLKCYPDTSQSENRTFIPRNPIRLDPCEKSDCKDEVWQKWVDEYPKKEGDGEGEGEESVLTGVRAAHTVGDWEGVRSRVVEGLGDRVVYSMPVGEQDEKLLMEVSRGRGPLRVV